MKSALFISAMLCAMLAVGGNADQKESSNRKEKKMDFIYGMTQGFFAPRGYYRTTAAEESVERLRQHGVNFVALVVNQYQEKYYSTRIFPSNVRTPDDDELALHIRRLHAAGIRVMLKPMVDPLDSVWRGYIHHRRSVGVIADVTSDYVTPWFESYREFILRYADLAEKEKCEVFCIGCELDGMEHYGEEWRDIVKMVRRHYSGLVTFNTTKGLSHDRDWFRDLDFVGFSGYFVVGPSDRTSSREEMAENWKEWKNKLKEFHDWVGKPIFFAETGTRPVVGAAGITADFNRTAPTYSEQEQADYYSATLDALDTEDWFLGTVWWKLDEFQKRPNYILPDGHYVGCEPTETLRRTMLERSKKKLTRNLK